MRPLVEWDSSARSSHASLRPLGVTASADALTGAAPSQQKTIVLTAFLVSGPMTHAGGSFKRGQLRGQTMTASLWRRVDRLLRTSPGLCQSDAELHVVHDLAPDVAPPTGSCQVPRLWAQAGAVDATLVGGKTCKEMGDPMSRCAIHFLPVTNGTHTRGYERCGVKVVDNNGRNSSTCYRTGVVTPCEGGGDGGTTVADQRAVRYHYFEPNTAVPADALRYMHFAVVLGREPTWRCAFMIDLSDVAVFRIPPCNALPTDALFAAIDGKVKRWLNDVVHVTRYNESWSTPFRSFLNEPTQQSRVLSCSTIGGARKMLMPTLLEAVERMRAHRRRLGSGCCGGEKALSAAALDMLVWNELALDRRVISGFPVGPVNLPPWGDLGSAACQAGSPHRTPTAADGVLGYSQCKHWWLNATRGYYWMGHKIPAMWLYDYLRWSPSLCRR